MPRGVLLFESPGTDKMLLAHAIAGEAGLSFFLVCGYDFIEMIVRVCASSVSNMFEQERKIHHA